MIVELVDINKLSLDPVITRTCQELGFENLVISIREKGQLQPISCLQDEEGNLLVTDGWRRVHALQFLGTTTAKIVVIGKWKRINPDDVGEP